jgi:hypothetical protein
VLEAAAEQAGHLVVFWQDPENQQALPELWEDMDAAVTIAAKAVKVAWKRRFNCPLNVSWNENGPGGVRKEPKMTLLARYQRACTLVGCAAISAKRRRSYLYTQALDELKMVTAVPEYRTWARTDPSFAELHDVDRIENVLCRTDTDDGKRSTATDDCEPEVAKVSLPSATMRALAAEYISGPPLFASDIADRFKGMTGDPCPADFLALPPFAGYRTAIEERGIHSAADLSRTAAELNHRTVATPVSELNITSDVAARWLNLADLYTWLRGVRPASRQAEDTAGRDKITTGLVFLLMKANLDSIDVLRQKLQEERGNRFGQFRASLIDCARPWAVVVPGTQDICCWLESLKKLPPRSRESLLTPYR